MEWRDRLLHDAILQRFAHHDLYYHVGLRPAAPPPWIVPDMAALTWLPGHRHDDDAPVHATTIWPPGVLRLARRLGLPEPEAVALVDSHERVHVHLSLEGVHEDEQEPLTRFVDAALLSFLHPRAGRAREERGLTHLTAGDSWEELLAGERDPSSDS